MSKGALSWTVLVALVSQTLAYELWAFDPDYSAAPSPENGPPLAANANRNPANLKWQILGIVGGYVFSVLIWGSLLLTVGRRLRRAAQASRGALSMEMVKPRVQTENISPWGSPGSTHKFSPKNSPEATIMPQFDPNTLENDRIARENEMERLYAHVLGTGPKQSKEPSVDEHEVSETSSGSSINEHPQHARTLSASSKSSFSQRNPPQLQSTVAPPPPTYPLNSIVSPLAAYTVSRGSTPTQPNRLTKSPSPHRGHSREVSRDSTRSGYSYSSNRPRHTRIIRNFTISAPIQNYTEDDEEEARRPLSPRNNPEMESQYCEITEPRPITPILDNEQADDEDVIETYGYEGLERRQPVPRPAPQRSDSGASRDTFTLRGLPDRPKLAPIVPIERRANYSAMSPATAGSTANPLPFRAIQPPDEQQHEIRYATTKSLSPSPTKTTFLSPRRENLRHPAGIPGFTPVNLGQRSAGLASPYSPYMPASPVTPVTPGLMTKVERKQRQREEGRRVAFAEEDLVLDEGEVWGNGW